MQSETRQAQIKRMLDEAVVLMRNAADTLQMEGFYVTPAAMRKWADEADAILEKETGE